MTKKKIRRHIVEKIGKQKGEIYEGEKEIGEE